MAQASKILDRVETPFGVFFCSDTSDGVVRRHLIENGAQQRGDLEMLASLLPDGVVVYDIGAHIGTISLALLRMLGPGSRAFVFEGSPDTFEVLKKNIAENGLDDRVSAFHAVVARESGHGYDLIRACQHRGRTQFSPSDAGGVASLRIDDLLDEAPPPDLLKIDVEGMEPEVIDGAWATVTAHRPILFFETNSSHAAGSALLDRLRGAGYRIFANTGERNGPTPAWLVTELAPRLWRFGDVKDILAIPREKVPRGARIETAWHWRSIAKGLKRRLVRK